MRRFTLALVLIGPVVLCSSEPAKKESNRFEGVVLPLVEALKKKDIAPDADTQGMAIVTADSKLYVLVKTAKSRLLFMDKRLANRKFRLTGKVVPGTQMLKVEQVQTIKEGKVFNVDYWCENCELAASEPGKCLCCGAETALRETPAD